MSDVAERVRAVLREQLGDPRRDNKEFADTDKLGEDLGADSLDAVELEMAIEDEFGVDVPDGHLSDDGITVGDLIAKVSALVG